MDRRGWLIAFEGIDGSGKTTQAEMLAERLRALGRVVTLTKEPTHGPYGQKIRELSTAGAPVTLDEELRYFVQDRRSHVDEVIQPALDAGEVVITDRYYLSNVAYQGARGLDPGEILEQNESQFPQPDAVVLVRVRPEEGLRRVETRGDELNRSYEQIDFLTDATEIFESIQRPYVHAVEGEGRPEDVHERVWAVVAAVLGLG